MTDHDTLYRRLSPILPVALYNGDERWTKPAASSDLIDLPAGSPLWPRQPELRYYLIDEGASPAPTLRADAEPLPRTIELLGAAQA